MPTVFPLFRLFFFVRIPDLCYIIDMSLRFLKISCLLPLLALLSACNEKVPVSSDPESTVTLRQNSPIFLPEQNLELTLLSIIDDTRCLPGDSSCVWPGMAAISLQMVRGESDTSFVTLAIGGTFPSDDSRYLWPLDTLGQHLTLLDLTPASAGANILDSSYRARILVQESSGPAFDDSKIIITNLAPEVIHIDPFEVDSIWLERTDLHVAVNYSGGCREHRISMFMSPDHFIDGQLKQATLRLRHYGAGDACRALVRRELLFKIGAITQQYKFTFGLLDSFQVALVVPNGDPPVHREIFVFEATNP